jgi:methionine aminotransferase
MQIISKQPHIGTTIFTIMSKLASDVGSLNLAQGFPSFDCSPELTDLVNFHMKKGHNQYAPMSGVAVLKEVIAEKTANLYGVNYETESEVTVVSGATEALYSAITAVVCPQDEVIIFEPAYDSYAPSVELNGGVPVYVALEPSHYQIDWDLVRQKFTPQTKLIIVNTPHNPTGKLLTKHDLDQLANLVKNTSIFILSDEVYEHITFDGMPHLSVMTNPILRERAFICGSFGKTFHITGWKIGYCLAPKALSAEFRKTHQWITFSTNTPIQYALADFLKKPEYYLNLPNFYQKKRDKFLACIKNSRFSFLPTQGSFFQIVNYQAITEENDYELAIRLTKEIGVASVPISVFYSQKNDYKMLRFCFAKDDEILERAGEKLSKL